ncbi:MAG TPA: hypothetical protein VJJ72_02390 [Candidatus Paceibacterota bacterium]
MDNCLRDRRAWESFSNKIKSLPGPLKHALFAAETAAYIQSLCLLYKLSDSQSAEIARITRDIILGDLLVGDMVKALSDKTGLDQNSSKTLAESIAKKVFLPVVQELKEHQKNRPEKTGPTKGEISDLNPHNVVNLREDK